jgi:hypothetical protein
VLVDVVVEDVVVVVSGRDSGTMEMPTEHAMPEATSSGIFVLAQNERWMTPLQQSVK